MGDAGTGESGVAGLLFKKRHLVDWVEYTGGPGEITVCGKGSGIRAWEWEGAAGCTQRGMLFADEILR